MQDRRTHIRYDLERAIEFELVTGDAHMVHRGIAMDVCDSGLGLYLFDKLPAGQKIIIKNGLEDTYREGTIVWCKELGDNVFRAGVMFTAWIEYSE